MSNGQTAERFIVPIGPQHPALKEPSSFQFTVDGETVTDAVVHLGYAHRGIEKAVEQRSWIQSMYLLERICGICSHIHAMAYCLGVEKLAGVEVPPRAQAIRVLVAELERIHSHMLWLGVAAHEAGFDTLFMYSWRDRELVMDILEGLTGNRVNYSANILGGVKYDIDEAQTQAILSGIDALEERTHHYRDVVSQDALFVQRTRGIAVMTRNQATVMGTVGPTARASNVPRDVRLDAPYAAYADYPVKLILDERGDLEARFLVRMDELFESYRLIRRVLASLPEGELAARMPRRVKEGEAISRVEAPRGELFYFIKSNGSDTPARVHVRTPTIYNMMSTLKLAVGHQLADVPLIVAGIDPCFSCNDRVAQINNQTWSWDDLRRYGIEFYQRKMAG